MRVAIVGSRDFPHLNWVGAYIERKCAPNDIIVSGGARGVDQAAAQAAQAQCLRVEEFTANWDELGKAAGKARNWDIVRQADRVVAFWDRESTGTAHAIAAAVSLGKPVEVYVS